MHQIFPRNENDLTQLQKLYEESDKVNFWKAPSKINKSVDIMVPQVEKRNFLDFLSKHHMTSTIVVKDLVKLLKAKEFDLRSQIRLRYPNERRLNDDYSRKLYLRMGEYYSYVEISWWLKYLEQKFPNLVEVISIGKTYEERSIYGVKIGAKKREPSRIIWIDGGIHAREWASVHTALYFVNELVSGYENDALITKYLNLLDFYIFPCVNPDGYEFTRTDQYDPAIRFWRKNRSPQKCFAHNGSQFCCKGVDLNRNFDFHFAEVGASSSPCSEIYRGENAFAELETKAIRDKVLSIKDRLDAFITLHTYSQLWIYPYSHKKNAYPSDVNDLKNVAKQAVESLFKLYGTMYRYGTGPETIYAYSGGSSDWVKQNTPTKYTYTIELRPSSFNWNGFVLDKRQLIPTARETFEGVKVVIDKIIEEHKFDPRKSIFNDYR
ncbi:unnamed protein product [Dracunculus medinensis]|uniref:Peptidase_M14 domain-containing protein n=1 Tax=Dracunculus medinensis TaxID=318479 RepID=A0A0N4UD07_DRAME|nr:unnamed protein product [Dracunculus medinensis]